jgi:hypothetical protein
VSARPSSVRARAGLVLHVTGLVLMPVAVLMALGGGSIYQELLLFLFALALVFVGRGLRARAP